jgi:hypothetical protein
MKSKLIEFIKHFIIAITFFAGVMASTYSFATARLDSDISNYAVSTGYIHGEGDVRGIKIALQYHSDYLQQYNSNLNLYFETSVNFWEYGVENNYDSNFVLALSPVFEYQFSEYKSNPIFVEFGIGVSLLDDTRFAGKNVSTHYQFEDRLGIVMKFGKNKRDSIALRYLHYSNAGFKRPNPGLDFISLAYTAFL